MSIEIDVPPEQSTSSLVSGILGDLQQLVEQQFQLTRREIEEELRQRAAAAAIFVLATGIFLVDAILFCLSLAHMLHWMASPPETDPAWLPLWACYAALAALLTVIGGVLLQIGRVRIQTITRFQNPVTEMMKVHSPWTTPQK